MNSNITMLLMVGLCASELTLGQDYVLLSNGESLDGKITISNPSYIKFMSAAQEKIQKLSADQINYVRSGYGYYYSKKVLTINTKHEATINQLVRLSSWGRIRVYSYTEAFGRSPVIRHYIEKDDSGLILIGRTMGLMRINNGLMLDPITEAVSNLFLDNPDLKNRFDADRQKGKRKVILKYVKEYNQWYQNSLK